LFLVLEESCRVQALQLSTVERLERALVLFLVVSWRIARLMRLGRTVPDLGASLLLEPEEWQAAYILAKKPLPKQLPRREAHARTALAHRPISAARIVSPVGVGLLDRCVRFELPEHLVANLALANGVFRQHRGDDFLRRGVDCQVQCAPGTPL
jgi:hypothetical protein